MLQHPQQRPQGLMGDVVQFKYNLPGTKAVNDPEAACFHAGKTQTFKLPQGLLPSPALKKTAFAQARVCGRHRWPLGPWTGPSTPRGRSWPCPSPRSSAGFGGADSTAGNPRSSARRPAVGGRQAGSSLSNLQNRYSKRRGGRWREGKNMLTC